ELHYAYGVTPNPLAGSSFALHEAALQSEVQMPQRTHVILGTTLAYQHAQQIVFQSALPAASADLVLFDFTIGWQPRPEIGVFARYSLFDQFGAPVTAVPMTTTTLPSLTRNTVLLGVNVVYPAVPAVRVPTRLGSRVDSTDQPGLPELHSQ